MTDLDDFLATLGAPADGLGEEPIGVGAIGGSAIWDVGASGAALGGPGFEEAHWSSLASPGCLGTNVIPFSAGLIEVNPSFDAQLAYPPHFAIADQPVASTSSYSPPGAAAEADEGPPKKRKRQQTSLACVSCKHRRVRCERADGEESCGPCLRKGIACIFEAHAPRKQCVDLKSGSTDHTDARASA